jgi:succinate dehydrogenase / fumarate reductase flavoprotein subunit/L-aspartate oxidase
MGNALLDILSMGRHAGAKAAQAAGAPITNRAGIGHVHTWQRELTLAGLPLHVKAPQLFPSYANFDMRVDANRHSNAPARVASGLR